VCVTRARLHSHALILDHNRKHVLTHLFPFIFTLKPVRQPTTHAPLVQVKWEACEECSLLCVLGTVQ